MNIAEMPLLGLLRERMSWLNARQTLLSQNVTNADAPGYTARDLKPLDFESMVKGIANENVGSSMTATDPRHISMSGNTTTNGYAQDDTPNFQTVNGNTVSLEEEMMKVSDTQAQYQAAANLYSKAINLIRTAIGKSTG